MLKMKLKLNKWGTKIKKGKIIHGAIKLNKWGTEIEYRKIKQVYKNDRWLGEF